MKIVELKIDDISEDAGVDGIALVERPAVEEDWFYFNWDKENQQFKNKRYKLIKGEYGFETTDQDTE